MSQGAEDHRDMVERGEDAPEEPIGAEGFVKASIMGAEVLSALMRYQPLGTYFMTERVYDAVQNYLAELRRHGK